MKKSFELILALFFVMAALCAGVRADMPCTGNACDDVYISFEGGCYMVKNLSNETILVALGPYSTVLKKTTTQVFRDIHGQCFNSYIGKNTANYANPHAPAPAPHPPAPPAAAPAPMPSPAVTTFSTPSFTIVDQTYTNAPPTIWGEVIASVPYQTCQPGYAVSGMSFTQKAIQCERVAIFGEESSITTSIVPVAADGSYSYCHGPGQYVRGFNMERTALVCSGPVTYQSTGSQLQDIAPSGPYGVGTCKDVLGHKTIVSGITKNMSRIDCTYFDPKASDDL